MNTKKTTVHILGLCAGYVVSYFGQPALYRVFVSLPDYCTFGTIFKMWEAWQNHHNNPTDTSLEFAATIGFNALVCTLIGSGVGWTIADLLQTDQEQPPNV